jgi:hypothetical protein
MKHLARTSIASVVVLLALAAGSASAPAPAERPMPRTHAHNDYAHAHPLLDALSNGFVSVEADVWLVGTELHVAHDRAKDWTNVPTFESLYLKPLADLKARRNSGGIYPDGTPILLLVDIKSEAVATYQRVHQVLGQFQAANPGLFTTYKKGVGGRYVMTRGAVNVVISGDRPREVMAAQAARYAAYDGRPSDIGPDVKVDDAPEFVPIISENWEKVFADPLKWDGTGEIPAGIRTRLEAMVGEVHREGKLLRFWKLPKDAPPVWAALYDAGVDLINTDDLPGLAAYVASRQPAQKKSGGR